MNNDIHPAFASLPLRSDLCHVIVAIPVCNEEAYLWQTLLAFCHQQTRQGRPVDPRSFEVLLLLNGCHDGSARIAERFRSTYSHLTVHLVRWNFPAAVAHVGSARSLLMEEAARRLETGALAASPALLLTTDADTVVDACWIAETVRCVQQGADAVGGDIVTRALDRRALPPRARRAYSLDRRYRRAVAQLESLLDPLAHDPWPRHQHHFGGSLACTLAAYRQCGGMQALPALEDLAFYRALLACGLRFRHEPRVRVYTSTRIEGRVSIGMSEQLGQWAKRRKLVATSLEFVAARFSARALLRGLLCEEVETDALMRCAQVLHLPVATLRLHLCQTAHFEQCWSAIDGDARVSAALTAAAHEGDMAAELGRLQHLIRQLRCSVEAHPRGRSRDVELQAAATMPG